MLLLTKEPEGDCTMSKDKKVRRRRRGAVIYTPIAVLLIGIIIIFGVSVFFRITDVQISGATKYTNDQILQMSGIKDGDNLLFVDKAAVAQAIGQGLPYLSEVVVEKDIPNRIVIKVAESKPLAAVKFDGDWWVIDQNARVLEKSDTIGISGKIIVSGLTPKAAGAGVVIAVDDSEKTKLQYLINVLSALESAGMNDRVSTLDVSNITDLTLEVDGRFTVSFGNGENAAYKLVWLNKIISQLGSDDRGQIIVSSDESAARFIPE
jgi:hypothetical protein